MKHPNYEYDDERIQLEKKRITLAGLPSIMIIDQ